MGDISRHRDIFLNTRAVTPAGLLAACRLSAADLTYLEMGNYLTDVSQFRDPVFYIFSKQRVWREFILPKVGDKKDAARGVAALAGIAGLAAGEILKGLASGTLSDIGKYGGPALAGLGGAAIGVLSLISDDTLAGLVDADEWIDKMLGTPVEKIKATDLTQRDQKHYGYMGQFFRSFIEGITHLLFAANIPNKVGGEWGKLDRISESSVTGVFTEFFTQYFPHEHTDQPPYVWDASRRPNNPDFYCPSNRQRNLVDGDIGVMNAVDKHYVQYLSEGLSGVEQEWRLLESFDTEGRHKLLVRMGKLLHGIEDWYFHSNMIELFRLRVHNKPKTEGEDDEKFLKRFVEEVAKYDPEFVTADAVERLRLKRRLYRRLRFPTYEHGTKTQSGGILSTKTSTTSLSHAYPAFPSQQDTTHTLLHALENLEDKAFRSTPHGGGNPNLQSVLEKFPMAFCVFQKFTNARGGQGDRLFAEKAAARGVTKEIVLGSRFLPNGDQKNRANAVITDVLREWIPLIATLLIEVERQRLVANVPPMQWPLGAPTPAQLKSGPPGSKEIEDQLERHKQALKRQLNEDHVTENNYERAIRYLVDCDFLNAAGQAALVKAFELDAESQKLLDGAPGAGGFLMQFSLDLQRALDAGDEKVAELNRNGASVFDPVSDNGAFNENIGSHSLMSKDTPVSAPYYNEARVLASVASMAVFHMMLEQVSGAQSDRRMPWKAILHYLIRYPEAGGWEQHAIALFRNSGGTTIPKYEDLPELGQLAEAARRSQEAQQPFAPGKKNDELKGRYVKLEAEVSDYRYP